MLPTTGFFKNIECPYYESICDRPYCHFRHRKKNISDESTNAGTPLPSTSLTQMPTYNPTPKSQLANVRSSHIPISYVPDLAGLPRERPFRYNPIKPIYKPTPLSVLSSVNTDSEKNVNRYDPANASPELDFNFEDLTNEFQMIDELIEDQVEPSDTPNGIAEEATELISEVPSDNNVNKSGCDNTDNVLMHDKSLKNESESPSKQKPKHKRPHKDSEGSENDTKKQAKNKKTCKDSDNSKANKHETKKSSNDSASQKRRCSESDSGSKASKNKELKSGKSKSSKSKDSDTRKNKKRRNSDGAADKKHKHKKDYTQSKSRDSDKKQKTDKHKSKRSRGKSDSDSENLKQAKTTKSKDKKHSKKSNSLSEDSEDDANSKHGTTNKKKRTKHSSTSDDSENDSHSKHSKSKRTPSSSKNTKSEKHTKLDKNSTGRDDNKHSKHSKAKHKSSSASEDSDDNKRTKDKTKSSEIASKSESKSKKSDTKSKNHSKSKHKKDHKDKHKTDKKESSKHKSDSKNKDEHKKSKSETDSKSKVEQIDEKLKIKKEESEPELNDAEYSDYCSDNDTDAMMQECFKIFTEYNPAESQIHLEINQTLPTEEHIPVIKKRIAHDNATQAKLTYTKPKTYLSAAQTMMNRFRSASSNVGFDEQSDILAEIRKLPEPVQSQEPKRQLLPKKVTQSSTLVDDIINGRTVTPKLRIAPVLNAGLLQKAKAQIDQMTKAKSATGKTLVQTVLKGTKRVAHIPETKIDIPDVLEIERSKLPVNVRSRFLTMMVDECSKFYCSREDAHQRAVSEEFKCYERCAALTTYRNSALLAINRLRKERQEREANGLDLILPGETFSSDKGESPITGRAFYNNIADYILSEEELVLHGFPRESTTPGRASIKPFKPQVNYCNLTENDRICARCKKHYQVDDDGFVLYEEECLYHPLKKRTFRGESIYLCCKSNDDSGCVTSNTHVCDNNENDCDGYQVTMANNENDPRNYAVYALDCEMCYTTRGLELTRITIVNSDCKTVYETLVKPLNPIIDYNTRFSGITKEQMERTATSILQVQANILHLCNSKTILIGHSLESDMKALKIIHNTIIDTSVIFPHKFGLPHKRALRDLAREYLKKIIQNDISGHDSAEDALTCMELVQWKVKEECKYQGNKI